MIRIMLSFVVCAFLFGCASHGQLGTLPLLNDSESACDLYVIRKSSVVGGAISYKVALDHQDIVAMGSGDYAQFKVTRGSHTITAKYPRQLFLGTAESSLEIDCRSSTSIYLYMTPGIKVNWSVLSAEEGTRLVGKSKFIELN